MMRYPSLQKKEAKIIVDMITPIHIEDLSKSQEQFLNTYQNLIRHNLSYGDFFICGNERQRLYWLGILTELGRINQRDTNFHQEMRHLIDVVGFGISEQAPVKPQKSVLKGVLPGIQPDDFLLIWFGGIWEWLEPFPLVKAVHAAHIENPRVKLYFSATRRPNGDIPQKAQATIALAESLNAHNTSVFFRDYPVPYHERDAYLLEADLGVLCQAPNLETQLSARTRILDHIWAGLPTLINPGDETAELIQRYNLGTVIPDMELNTIKNAILELANNRDVLTQKAENVVRIQSKFYWKNIIEPIEKFIN